MGQGEKNKLETGAFKVITLGCAKNSVDSESMASLLAEAGYSDGGDNAEVIVVNTCGFLDAARRQSVDVLSQLAAQKRPGQLIIAAGCMAQRWGSEIVASVPQVDAIVGTQELDKIAGVVREVRAGTVKVIPESGALLNIGNFSKARSSGNNVDEVTAALAPPDLYPMLKLPSRRSSGPSAYLKISDGCNAPCTFCIIPAIKGAHRSKPPEQIVREARELAAAGVQEVVLIAQDTTYYGRDIGRPDGLADLLVLLAKEVPELPWVRIMYAYPAHVSARLIETMASVPQVVKYLDVPLQHAHPETLRRMKRPSNPDRNRRLIANLRAAIPDIALRTTFIVGFPGETDEEFSGLLDFIEEMQLDHAGAFTYSPENGSPAAELLNPVPRKVKQERYNLLMEKQQKISTMHNAALVGRTLDVLIEGEGEIEEDGTPLLVGRATRHAPEVDGMVFIQQATAMTGLVQRRRAGKNSAHKALEKAARQAMVERVMGKIVPVHITTATEYDLWGEI